MTASTDTPRSDVACGSRLEAEGLAKTYGVRGKPAPYDPAATYHAIDLGPYYRIAGSGRDRHLGLRVDDAREVVGRAYFRSNDLDRLQEFGHRGGARNDAGWLVLRSGPGIPQSLATISDSNDA